MQSEEEQSRFVREIGKAFSPEGRLACKSPGFVSRPGQIAFAQSVAAALEKRDVAVLEAGTGTGKTFGYLVPVLMSGKKAIVSTAGKTLQEQLFKKDIPALEAALGIHVTAKLLKGRANYICLKRMKEARVTGLPSPAAFADLKRIEAFAMETSTGDRAEVKGVAEDSVIWPFVTSTRENCNPQKCPFAERCFVNRARQEAKEAEVVVVNHHLFLSAMAVRDQSNTEMLPESDIVIFDEAHKLAEIGSSFFSEELSTRAVGDIYKDIRRMTMSRHRQSLKDKGETWETLYDEARNSLLDFILELDNLGVLEGTSVNVSKIENIAQAKEPLHKARNAATKLADRVELVMEDDEDLKACHALLSDAIDLMAHWEKAFHKPEDLVRDAAGKPYVRWIERTSHDLRLKQTPLSFAEDFSRMVQNLPYTAWVFTSATLATGKDDFTHFLKELGLEDAEAKAWQSPFDFPNQALLYIPPDMPNPNDKVLFTERLVDAAWPIIDMLKGRTLFLCTSRQAMVLAAESLRERVRDNARAYEVYVQNEDSRHNLLTKFRTADHAILVATMGFWEGIDIKGEALSLVVIDKIPFAPKDDPVLEARCQWIRTEGGNPFRDHQVPLAAISLKQGVGRLIRSETDRGILIVGDTRIIPRSMAFDGSNYGSMLIESIPPFSKTRYLERAIDFWLHPGTWH